MKEKGKQRKSEIQEKAQMRRGKSRKRKDGYKNNL